jgi:hypothetical protein
MGMLTYSVFDGEGNKSDFFKIILPHIPSFIQIKINQHLIDKINDKILKQLKIQSLSSLRKSYEGVTYYDKTIQKIGGLYTIHKISKSMHFDFDINTDCNLIEIENEEYEILIFKFGQMPKLKSNNQRNILIVMQRDKSFFYFCGLFKFNKKFVNKEFLTMDDFNNLIKPKDFLENVRNH